MVKGTDDVTTPESTGGEPVETGPGPSEVLSTQAKQEPEETSVDKTEGESTIYQTEEKEPTGDQDGDKVMSCYL